MSEVTYIVGNAFDPIDCGFGTRIIAHVCNDAGVWGVGFTGVLARRWRGIERDYRKWSASGDSFQLGAIRLAPVTYKVCVAHMVAQQGSLTLDGREFPIRYDALAKCLQSLGRAIRYSPYTSAEPVASIHMPRIGGNLAEGNWLSVVSLIIEHLLSRNISVFVYDPAPVMRR